MTHDLPLLIALIAPVVLFTVLRVNASVVFLSLCLGQVLVQYVAADTIAVLTAFLPHASELSRSTLQLVFLYGPAVATTVLMLASIRGKIKRLINMIPAAGVGLLGVLLGVPLFTPGLRHALQSGMLWPELTRAQALLVGITALISLLFLWLQRSSGAFEEKKSRRHHS